MLLHNITVSSTKELSRRPRWKLQSAFWAWRFWDALAISDQTEIWRSASRVHSGQLAVFLRRTTGFPRRCDFS